MHDKLLSTIQKFLNLESVYAIKNEKKKRNLSSDWLEVWQN